MTIVLSTTSFTALILATAIPPCDTVPCKKELKIISTRSKCIILVAYLNILLLVQNVLLILSDLLAFLAVIRQLWGLWKEKRRSGLHSGKDFATLLLQQGILRFSFVLFVTITLLVIDYISPIIGSDIGAFQNVLSVILICEFTLDLRRRNTTTGSLPGLSALEFPDLNPPSQHNPEVRPIQSILVRIQESIIADMREKNNPVSIGIDTPSQGEPDLETAWTV
ncbi:hypothetical protein Clacol_004571 [Clathrus columnatus]|uniref:Uncharacterized protein n=1 Tax=Clathrus columnatus TaxID=1419009 RepID=A0AAV5AEG8_9AGAM|nr:hypothetical protein Clacol_004571 [Clathrus columnatus]